MAITAMFRPCFGYDGHDPAMFSRPCPIHSRIMAVFTLQIAAMAVYGRFRGHGRQNMAVDRP